MSILKNRSSTSLAGTLNGEDVHLVVLVHGLWGNPNHMDTIEKTLFKSLKGVSQQRIVTIKPSSFRFWKTYDGIQRCAELVIADIFFEIETLKQTNKYKVTSFSIIGYSLGGLISRYVIGTLEAMGFFDEVTPIFYSTFATPHIGVRFFKRNFFDLFANSCAPYLFGRTGQQLFLTDSEQLLSKMADPSSVYYKGLERFQSRILMANIKNDRSVAFYTSFITNYSPFDSLDYVDIKYLKELPSAVIGKLTVWPKFVDLTRSLKVTNRIDTSGNTQEETSIIRSNKFLRYTILIMAASILIPFYIPLVLTLSFCVSSYSKIKIRLLRSLELEKHWGDVKQSVYRGGQIDSEHALQGESRRIERIKLSRQESIKRDTSNLTENAFGNVMFAEQNFVDDHTHLYDENRPDDNGAIVEDIGGESEIFSDLEELGKPKETILGSLLRVKPRLEIPFQANDSIIETNIASLKSLKAKDIPLFSEEAKLPSNKRREELVENLNSLEWIKIPVYYDLFNAHDSIVARTGGFRNPKATSTIFLWGSILRNHLKQEQTKN